MAHYFTGELLASFLALTFLEIVLGIDNIVFLAVAVHRLERTRRRSARQLGLALAMVLRILMLLALVWLTQMAAPLFHVMGRAVSIKDLVLVAGGLFLLAKGTTEIHEAIEGGHTDPHENPRTPAKFLSVILQIGLINIIFSIDSVVTAVGMTNDLPVMIAAVVVSTLVMLFAAKGVGDFIHHRPTTKMLALCFILLIGLALVADGLGFHLPRGYLYFAIAFSLLVEGLNIVSRRRGEGPKK